MYILLYVCFAGCYIVPCSLPLQETLSNYKADVQDVRLHAGLCNNRKCVPDQTRGASTFPCHTRGGAERFKLAYLMIMNQNGSWKIMKVVLLWQTKHWIQNWYVSWSAVDSNEIISAMQINQATDLSAFLRTYLPCWTKLQCFLVICAIPCTIRASKSKNGRSYHQVYQCISRRFPGDLCLNLHYIASSCYLFQTSTLLGLPLAAVLGGSTRLWMGQP